MHSQKSLISDDGFEIEVVDDTPEEDKGKPRRAESAQPNVPDDDEVEKYSEGVQKRIKQLKFEYHEERRAKEESARLQEEALRFAQQVKAENEQLRKTLSEGEGVLVNQAKGRVSAELDKAKAAFKVAYEAGDPDALTCCSRSSLTPPERKVRYDNYTSLNRSVLNLHRSLSIRHQQLQPRKPDQTCYGVGQQERLV